MLVGAEYFQGEALLPLYEAAKKMNPPRSKVTLWTWHKQGHLNQSGTRVEFHVCPMSGGYHTSLEETGRFINAITSLTVKAEVVGGSLHGLTFLLPDTDEIQTAENLQDQINGRVVPMDECYIPTRFIDKFGKPRTFLVYQELDGAREKVIQMLEGE